MADEGGKVANWRIVLAAILDFLTAFFLFGFLVGAGSGELTGAPEGSAGAGFSLSGWSALILLVLIVLYFVIGNRLGGTLWKRILGVPARR